MAVIRIAQRVYAPDELARARRGGPTEYAGERFAIIEHLVRAYRQTHTGTSDRRKAEAAVEEYLKRNAKEAARAHGHYEAARRYLEGARTCMKLEGYEMGHQYGTERVRRMLMYASNHAIAYRDKNGDPETYDALDGQISSVREEVRRATRDAKRARKLARRRARKASPPST